MSRGGGGDVKEAGRDLTYFFTTLRRKLPEGTGKYKNMSNNRPEVENLTLNLLNRKQER
jgi:hypothetical protein